MAVREAWQAARAAAVPGQALPGSGSGSTSTSTAALPVSVVPVCYQQQRPPGSWLLSRPDAGVGGGARAQRPQPARPPGEMQVASLRCTLGAACRRWVVMASIPAALIPPTLHQPTCIQLYPSAATPSAPSPRPPCRSWSLTSGAARWRRSSWRRSSATQPGWRWRPRRAPTWPPPLASAPPRSWTRAWRVSEQRAVLAGGGVGAGLTARGWGLEQAGARQGLAPCARSCTRPVPRCTLPCPGAGYDEEARYFHQGVSEAKREELVEVRGSGTSHRCIIAWQEAGAVMAGAGG